MCIRDRIIDAAGRTVHTTNIQGGEIEKRISVSEFEQGVYQVIITSDGVLLDQKRFIKI